MLVVMLAVTITMVTIHTNLCAPVRGTTTVTPEPGLAVDISTDVALSSTTSVGHNHGTSGDKTITESSIMTITSASNLILFNTTTRASVDKFSSDPTTTSGCGHYSITSTTEGTKTDVTVTNCDICDLTTSRPLSVDVSNTTLFATTITEATPGATLETTSLKYTETTITPEPVTFVENTGMQSLNMTKETPVPHTTNWPSHEATATYSPAAYSVTDTDTTDGLFVDTTTMLSPGVTVSGGSITTVTEV